MMVTWIYGRTSFVVERNVLGHLKLQTWAIPKYNIQVIKHFPFSEDYTRINLYSRFNLCIRLNQYFMHWQRESINNLIEDAILEADERGTKVLSLGLMNQASLAIYPDMITVIRPRSIFDRPSYHCRAIW